jgi:hypothetical protein
MSDADDWDIAQAMIRLYGRKAETMAENHALGFARDGNIADYDKWWRVKEIVSGLKPRDPDLKKTRH